MSRRPPTRVPLGTASLIAAAMYVTGVVILPLLGTFVKLSHPAPAATLRLLTVALAANAILDYPVSLWVEWFLLRAMEIQGTASGSGALVIMMAAFGFAMALYGFMLGLLGAARWPIFFYALCFIHGVHLLARAQSFPRPTDS